MTPLLETLLVRLRDGLAVAGDLDRVKALVARDDRIPAELRDVVFGDPAEAAEDAAGLLAVLGVDDVPLDPSGLTFGAILAEAVRVEAGPAVPAVAAAAVDELDPAWEPIARVLVAGLRAEADGFDVADAVMEHVPGDFRWGALVADAVQAEAGAVEVAQSVLTQLHALDSGRNTGVVPLAVAIAAEAGTVDVADAVMRALDLDPRVDLREAVLAEAGAVDVADAVVAALELGARRAPSLRLVRTAPAPAPVAPTAANARGWSAGAVALAATALIAFGVGRLLVPATAPVAAADVPLSFAHAGDVVVEDLSYAENVVVFQTEGDQGAVILWLDEEA